MTSVLLIYPFFKPRQDRSVFRFPPLGISYVAASLLEAGFEVQLLDCTFLSKTEALESVLDAQADVVGIYCMASMVKDCLWLASRLQRGGRLLVTGGPLPTVNPIPFLEWFDVVVRGEAEQTMKELIFAYQQGSDFSSIEGLAYHKKIGVHRESRDEIILTTERLFEKELDRVPFPARHLLPNAAYIQYGQHKYGYSITTVMSSRGCPFRCEFCSNTIFGGSLRQRSTANILDEIEETLQLGYERISFADDVFTFNKERVFQICAEIKRRGLQFQWECLGRVDELDYATALEMKSAGCYRIFFGIESGCEQTLSLMNKNISLVQARHAVESAHRAGLQVGAFFILFYPGESDEMVLNTLRFANSLPLDYLGLSRPYLLPGTALYERMKHLIKNKQRMDECLLGFDFLSYQADFSDIKMRFGILKGRAQFELKKRYGKQVPFLISLFEKTTDIFFKILK